jgi:hypothetical protein
VVCVDTGCGVKSGPLTAVSFASTTAYQIWPSGELHSFNLEAPHEIERRIARLISRLPTFASQTRLSP